MKRGLLLYTPEDAQRNRWFIEQLCLNAEPEGLSLRLSLTNDPETRTLLWNEADFLVNRSREYIHSMYAEGVRKIPCFNSAKVTGITNQKYSTYTLLHGHYGIPMAQTWQFSRNAPLPELTFPLVAKPADGHGGQEVAWLDSPEELAEYKARFDAAHPEETYPFLVQTPVVTGWDVRIYVLGGKIYSAVLRTSDADFRSNFSLGGRAELIEPDDEMKALVRRIQEVLPLDFAGIDLLRFPEGGYLLGEIEDAVGCRMLYQLTDKNPAKDFIAYIGRRLRESE